MIRTERTALLLDFDGTLVPVAATPDAVRVGDDLRDLIAGAITQLEGRVAIISGRSLEQLDDLWGPALGPVTVAASHGLELRCDGQVHAPPPNPVFERLARETEARFGMGGGVLIELKSFGLGIHYRLAPDLREEVGEWASRCASEHQLVIQRGDMVFELRLPGADKGDAVRAIMALGPFAGSTPVYMGDDLTDIPAIAAARAFGGRGIAVGARIAAHADEAVPDAPAAIARIREWIA